MGVDRRHRRLAWTVAVGRWSVGLGVWKLDAQLHAVRVAVLPRRSDDPVRARVRSPRIDRPRGNPRRLRPGMRRRSLDRRSAEPGRRSLCRIGPTHGDMDDCAYRKAILRVDPDGRPWYEEVATGIRIETVEYEGWNVSLGDPARLLSPDGDLGVADLQPVSFMRAMSPGWVVRTRLGSPGSARSATARPRPLGTLSKLAAAMRAGRFRSLRR